MLRADKKLEWCYCNDLQVIKKKWLKGAEEAYMMFLEQINGYVLGCVNGPREFLLGRRVQEGTGRVGVSGPGEAFLEFDDNHVE
ncbi:hypothetical protein ALC57_14523 [Trachymyrmex cornetzi]|uniref:Uncharacterized protein n=1 Tax=Trachymyrmex cornetzi TaxID=471704 RepID=A0A151IYN5_9HYME|nr:hypothetical protein ALC57_14523 [Trachymyrmex cornetzi]